MSGISRKLQRQRRKQCIFCANPVGSKEHFWSEWMHPLLPTIADARHNREQILYTPIEGERVAGARNRQGDPRTVKLRVVCRACNNGWMNSLEQEARPFLTPLITGFPVTLDGEAKRIVARWITLKCMVSEHGPVNMAVTPRQDREAFKITGEIPDYFRIYMTSHAMKMGVSYVRQSNCMVFDLTSGPRPPLLGMPHNIQTISFLLGRVFVHLNAARVDDFDLESRVTHNFAAGTFWNLTRLWPTLDRPEYWPRRPLLDSNGVGLIIDTLPRYRRASKVTWIDSIPT